MRQHPLLGLVGYAGAGKDTIAGLLGGWTRVAFADQLKQALYDTDPRVGEHLRVSELVDARGWDLAKQEHPEVRALLQRLGVAVRRLDHDFWVRAALDQADQADGPVVVTDVRFDNEVEAIRQRGGVVAHVENPDVGRTSDHESEDLADSWHHGVPEAGGPDLGIYNPGDGLARLQASLQGAVPMVFVLHERRRQAAGL